MDSEPEARDICTPDVSVVNTNILWDQNRLQMLLEYRAYALELEHFCDMHLVKGPFADVPIPKKPKGNLKDLFGEKHSKKVPLNGMDLHNYMKSRLVKQDRVEVTPWDPSSLDTMKSTLAQGFAILKQHNAKLLKLILEYGKYLQLAFDRYSIYKIY